MGNILDHPIGSVMFYASDEIDTMNDIWNDPEAMNGRQFIQLCLTNCI